MKTIIKYFLTCYDKDGNPTGKVIEQREGKSIIWTNNAGSSFFDFNHALDYLKKHYKTIELKSRQTIEQVEFKEHFL